MARKLIAKRMRVNILPKEYTKDANGIETCQQKFQIRLFQRYSYKQKR